MKKKPIKSKRSTKNKAKKFYKIIFSILSFFTVIISLILFFLIKEIPNFDKHKEFNHTRKITIYDNEQRIIANHGDLYGKFIKFENLPKHLIQAVLATEDKRFFHHFGIDVFGLIRAFFVNISAGKVVQGGSTITQQLAKIIYLTPEKTLKRKIQELILAFYLENKLTKEEILELYLNRVYLGSALYGVDAAAKFYFGKNVSDLSIKESAIITGLLKAPTKYSPKYNSDISGKRAYQVLLNMIENNYIDEEDLEEILSDPVLLETSAFGYSKDSYFVNWIVDEVNQLIPANNINLNVYTNYDSKIQNIADNILRQNLLKYKDLNVSQGAIIIMKPNGMIYAMVGGIDYNKSSFNRATQAYRQPGSVFKHIVYLTAFEKGYYPDNIELDEEINIGKWQPKNSTKKFYGKLTLRDAFARSINTITVKISEKVGIKNIIDTAYNLGIKTELSNLPSIALGTKEINLLELTGSYAVLANEGIQQNPYSIEKIVTDDTQILYKKTDNSIKVVSLKAVNYMKDLLYSAVKYGSAHRAYIENKKIYAKTGTSQQNRDAWFIGFDENYVIGIWVGNDNDSPTKTYGSFLPAIIFREIIENLS